MREIRERGRKLPQVKPKKKIWWRKDKGTRDREKKKRKKEKDKKEKQRGKGRKERGRVRDTGEKKKKKGTTLPFAISGEPAVETHRGKRQSWPTQRELRVGTRNCGFHRIPKGRVFSYTGYFLPSDHISAILVQL